MAQPKARPVIVAASTAARLITGRTPGRPRQTGQTWVFGGAAKYSALHPQNILLLVSNWAWTSRPMTVSYRVPAPGAGAVPAAFPTSMLVLVLMPSVLSL